MNTLIVTEFILNMDDTDIKIRTDKDLNII